MLKIRRFLLPLVCLSQLTLAGPWIEPGDPWLRSDIELLADTGVITVPITTWPIMWSSIRQDMQDAMDSRHFSSLSEREQQALIRLKRAFRRDTRSKGSMGVELASDPEVLRGFSNSPRETATAFSQRQYVGDNWAYNFKLNYVLDPYIAPNQTEDSLRYDGSYIAAVWGNVITGIGWIDKWWGPGQETSVLLSTNARPTRGLFIQRNESKAFESDWLSWIGPWTAQIFATVLDDVRHIDDAKLLGMSITFKPIADVEIGLRRTAQWGGAGRQESFETFVNLLLGRDNCGSSGIDDCATGRANEPGNQIAGVDARWTLPTDDPMSIYLQIMGEDEADLKPSKKSFVGGYTWNTRLFDTDVKTYLEYTDTRTHSTQFGLLYNVAYNHSIYQTGYRYLGRNLASTLDNDSRMFSLGTVFNLEDNQRLALTLRHMDINEDGAGLHTLSTEAKSAQSILVNYEYSSRYGLFQAYLQQSTDIIDSYNRQSSETMLGGRWTLIF